MSLVWLSGGSWRIDRQSPLIVSQHFSNGPGTELVMCRVVSNPIEKFDRAFYGLGQRTRHITSLWADFNESRSFSNGHQRRTKNIFVGKFDFVIASKVSRQFWWPWLDNFCRVDPAAPSFDSFFPTRSYYQLLLQEVELPFQISFIAGTFNIRGSVLSTIRRHKFISLNFRCLLRTIIFVSWCFFIFFFERILTKISVYTFDCLGAWCWIRPHNLRLDTPRVAVVRSSNFPRVIVPPSSGVR